MVVAKTKQWWAEMVLLLLTAVAFAGLGPVADKFYLDPLSAGDVTKTIVPSGSSKSAGRAMVFVVCVSIESILIMLGRSGLFRPGRSTVMMQHEASGDHGGRLTRNRCESKARRAAAMRQRLVHGARECLREEMGPDGTLEYARRPELARKLRGVGLNARDVVALLSRVPTPERNNHLWCNR